MGGNEDVEYEWSDKDMNMIILIKNQKNPADYLGTITFKK